MFRPLENRYDNYNFPQKFKLLYNDLSLTPFPPPPTPPTIKRVRIHTYCSNFYKNCTKTLNDP